MLARDEQQLWMGRPSPWVNTGRFISTAVLTVLASFVLQSREIYAQWLSQYLFPLSENHVLFIVLGVVCLLYLDTTWAVIKTYNILYVLSSRRLMERSGVFSKQSETLELYRVIDSTVFEPLGLRIIGCGIVRLITDDRSTPNVVLYAVESPLRLQTLILRQVEAIRLQRGVRQIELQ